MSKLIQQYGCGPVQFTGTDNALYERHLIFDNVVELMAAGPRERFEAFARSVRDVLSQRWLHTEKTYERANPKRVYYLSMEFLIGRSLANNVTNLLLDPVAKEAVKQKNLDWFELLEQEPDAGLGNGGLGRLAACFLDSMATMQIPAMGYGLRYEYGIFKQSIQDGWQHELPGQLAPAPGPVGGRTPARDRGCEAQLFLRGARRNLARGHRPSVESDRCSVRSPRGGLRRQDHQYAPALGSGGTRLLQLSRIQQRRFRRRAGRDARGRIAHTGTVSRRPHKHGAGIAFRAGVFSRRLLAGRSRAALPPSNADWSALPEKVAIQLNDTHPTMAVPELMRILLDEAHLGWDQAWDLTQKTLAYTNHTLLPEALEKWPVAWFETDAAASSGDHL